MLKEIDFIILGALILIVIIIVIYLIKHPSKNCDDCCHYHECENKDNDNNKSK